jgi:hypothetical protein
MKLWRRCEICNKDFFMEADACPNNVGHVLTVVTPQPVEQAPPAETKPEEGAVVDAEFEAPGEKLEGEAREVMEDCIDRAREVGGAQMEAEVLRGEGEPGKEEG